ncbi:MAG: sodium:proton antiporter, partial [Rikenellaceae bacterium]|nr:sodium:proton antiporter [Rikenellaceae bacterium]
MENAIIIVFVGLLVFASHVFTGIFERKRIPDVLLLMLIGLLLGPIFGLIT